jgi:hypothetical protein
MAYKQKQIKKGRPTQAVFRVELADGKMRITDEKGDDLPEDEDVTPEKLEKYGIDTTKSELLAVLFYAKCNEDPPGGCVLKIVNGRQVLVW